MVTEMCLPFSSIQWDWMSTERSLNSAWNPDFSEHSVRIQWTFRNVSVDWKENFHPVIFINPPLTSLNSSCVHMMRILISINWNISECPLNPHGMFTEIRISRIVQWPLSEHSVPLNAIEFQFHIREQTIQVFFNFQGKKL